MHLLFLFLGIFFLLVNPAAAIGVAILWTMYAIYDDERSYYV